MKRQTTIHALLLILAIVIAMVTDMHAVATKTFSDGWTPIYYDIRSNVTSLREITDFGTLRVTDNTYTFTNQPLTTKMTESGGVTMLTENTYDTNSGLLVATDVTVNGVKQRVSKVTYDDLGRIASVVRGNGANSGGTVSYSYNLHGQTTAINGPGFSQKLHYTDGPGKPLYNGNISSMLWTMGSDATQRGYKYTYNGYNWLTLAEYGEGSTLSSHKDRYTERFSEFMLNGGIRRLQRHGLKADGNYGKIDNLHISYYGNRITTVLEDADPVTQSGSMDYPGAKREMRFGYNDWGALVSDESRGIEVIEYDSFGNPVHIKFSGRDYTKNVYSATGVKLKTEHYTDPLVVGPPAVGEIHQSDPVPEDMQTGTGNLGPGTLEPGTALLAGQEKIEYHGPVIYRNFKIDMVLFPGGYATIGNDNAVTFHYYTQDYLGNNRAVVNGSTGVVEQTTAYYPYGAVIPDLGTGNSGQPFKFGGKELVSANGLNMYDFGARLHYPAIPQFDRIDPMAEKYTWLSPYLYCGNNPVNLVDRDGREVNLWGTTLPGAKDLVKRTGATHTFITVKDKNNKIHYFAYGSNLDGISGAIGGQLTKQEYNQDKRIYKGDGNDPDLKIKITVEPPEGMSQEDFDKSVIDTAESFGNDEGISYNLLPLSDVSGNCNSSTSTILKKAGLSEEQINKLGNQIPGIKWGFGNFKPWTKDEQQNAVEQYKNSYESLQHSLP